jgi:hypothetical protein
VAGCSGGGVRESAATRVRFGGAGERPDGCADGNVSGTRTDGGAASVCLDVVVAGAALSVDLVVSVIGSKIRSRDGLTHFVKRLVLPRHPFAPASPL